MERMPSSGSGRDWREGLVAGSWRPATVSKSVGAVVIMDVARYRKTDDDPPRDAAYLFSLAAGSGVVQKSFRAVRSASAVPISKMPEKPNKGTGLAVCGSSRRRGLRLGRGGRCRCRVNGSRSRRGSRSRCGHRTGLWLRGARHFRPRRWRSRSVDRNVRGDFRLRRFNDLLGRDHHTFP